MDSRVHKAQRLFIRMNTLLGSDYDKKMAVVGILKQFAEDHVVEKLAFTLNIMLQTYQERKLIEDIRPFVAYRQREVFDAILNIQHPIRSTKILEQRRLPTPDLTQGERRVVTVTRRDGAFGFVLRGHNPVYIASVDANSAAQKAGLQRGDCILKLNGLNVERASHNHLVKLLQGSGNTPTFEVLHMVDQDGLPIRPESVASTYSAESSEEDSSWMNEAVLDREGRPFKQRADHLLTKRERERLGQAMYQYNETRDIKNFYKQVSEIFNAPCKMTLWMYLIPKLTTQHKDYCLRRISVPHHLLLDVYPKDQLDLLIRTRASSHASPSIDFYDESLSNTEINEINDIDSFKQQLEYILTPRERMYLKNALQIYAEKRNIYNLVEDVGCIFDTPSKRTIWFYLIPLLAGEDQDVCRRLLSAPSSGPQSPNYPPAQPDSPITYTSENKTLCGGGGGGTPPVPATPKYGDVMYHNEDDFKYVGIAADMLRARENFANGAQELLHDPSHNDIELYPDDDRRIWRSAPINSNYGTLNQQYIFQDLNDSSERAVSPPPDYSISDSNSLPDSLSSMDYLDLPQYEKPTSTMDSKNEIVILQQSSRPSDGKSSNRSYRTMLADDPQVAELIPSQYLNSNAKVVIVQEQAPETQTQRNRRSSTPQRSLQSQDSFAEKARDAIQALDDVVAQEYNTDVDDSTDEQSLEHQSRNKTIPAAPPFPSVAIPKAPPPPVVRAHYRDHHNQMYVKRLNWEKLEIPNTSNTVWAQINDPSDLQDVVKYLELEHKFSTKKTDISSSFNREKRHQITILHPKKAYNVSILMGHLKMSVQQLKEALFMIDEEIFTPELLEQLITYAPDDEETKRYEVFNGLKSDLTKPDQFGLEMVKIPGYSDRLKAMLFKANFAEKLDEVRSTMIATRKASSELMNSKRLAKLLELVLAMGNAMNKGNKRIGEAAAFKIYSLSNLETTKTSDGKRNFLHVLANAVAEKFPDVLRVKEDLANVPIAAKSSHETIHEELVDLRNVLQDIQRTMDNLADVGLDDRFHEVMGHFIGQAGDEIQQMYSMQIQTEADFSAMLEYFGESATPNTGKKGQQNSYDIFRIFTEFLYRFENAHRENLLHLH